MSIKQIEKEIEVFTKKSKGEVIVVFFEKERMLKNVDIGVVRKSIEKTILFLNKEKNMPIKYSKNKLLLIDVEKKDYKSTIKNHLGVNVFPAVLLVKDEEIIDFCPFLVEK